MSTSSPSSSFLHSLTTLGLGYTIAVALCVLLILSSLLLAFYLCSRSPNPNPNPNPRSASNGVTVSRGVFVDDADVEESGIIGLDPAAINSYPKFTYSVAKGGENVCAVCLSEYREGEMMRMMPDCRHCFHLVCVDEWLRMNCSCPVCRTSPMPTPLSEVVPLSQFAGDRRRM